MKRLQLIIMVSVVGLFGLLLLIPSPPATSQDARIPTGIMEGVEGPWPARAFKTQNFWQGKIDGEFVGVYAGGPPDNPQQGAIMLFTEKTNGPQPFDSPTATGPLKVTSEQDGVLTLLSTGRVTYHFDLRHKTFF